MKKDIRTLAALLIASATFAACSSDDSNNENQQPANGKYTMVINASKGNGANTRALSLDGSTLNATWAEGENVYVKKGSDWATGYLQPQAGGATATLKGTLSDVTISAGDDLTLQFPRSRFGQDHHADRHRRQRHLLLREVGRDLRERRILRDCGEDDEAHHLHGSYTAHW